jgi:DNA polymerase-4
MDAFFAAIEIRDQPHLRGLPVIVGGVTARGVVCAASYEAREFGVRSAMPTFRARELCPKGVFLNPDMPKYARISQEIHEIFYEFTSQIEPIALDEAYLDVTGSLSLFHTPLALARELKRRVHSSTGLVVSVGIGPNKLVAKIACTSGKPNGLVIVPPEQVVPLLTPLPIRKLWGIGQVTERALKHIGILTIGDLQSASRESLLPIFGARTQEVVHMAWGHDNRSVEANRESQSIGEESTFEVDTREIEFISPVITAHSEAVARRLRQLGLRAHTVTLKLKLANARGRTPDRNFATNEAPHYPLISRSKTLPTPTQDGAQIRAIALKLWHEAAVGEKVRLVGVSASQFENHRQDQLELFAADRKRDRLGETLDAIQDRFGAGAIRRAVATPEKLTPSQQRKPGEREPKRRG